MNRRDAILLASLLRSETINGRYLYAYLDMRGDGNDRIVFANGFHGDHDVALAASDDARIRAHFDGYCANNGTKATKMSWPHMYGCGPICRPRRQSKPRGDAAQSSRVPIWTLSPTDSRGQASAKTASRRPRA